jgi:methionyl-tRNA synthetase
MIKTDAGRVQTQMYVALQIAAALSSLANHSCLLQPLNYRILKIESPLNWSTISETSDLLLAGHQIGEAELFSKLKTKKFKTNRQTRSN